MNQKQKFINSQPLFIKSSWLNNSLMKSITLILVILLSYAEISQSQNYLDKKRDLQWVVGNFPWGMKLDFSTNPFTVSTCNFPLHFSSYNATCISDTNGTFLYATNGARVIGKDYNYLLHGDSLSYGWAYNLQNGNGNDIPFGNMILPMPVNDSLYYVFHEMLDWIQVPGGTMIFTTQLMYSVINQKLNQGIGDIILKNQRIILDTLHSGFAATRHANGRDWWLIVPRNDTQSFYIILFSKAGIQEVKRQDIGNLGCLNPPLSTYLNLHFSPQGDRLALAARARTDWNFPAPSYTWIRLYDFDRCTGTLSNFRESCEYWNDSSSVDFYSAVFSPNGQYLYANGAFSIHQYDISVDDFGATRQLIATWDGYIDTITGYPTYFGWPELFSDNRIYYPANSINYLHVIENPDLAWPGCQVIQRKVQTSRNIGHWLPNFPNFRLGPVSGSVCDSLNVGVPEHETEQTTLTLIPNPADEYTLCQITGNNTKLDGILYVYEPSGRIVWQARVNSKEIPINTQNIANGLYLLRFNPRKGMPVHARLVVSR